MRARLAIAYSNQVVEIREVVLKDKPSLMINMSPKATVPVLVLTGDTVLEESLEIMKWALQKNDPDKWLSQTSANLIDENDSTFKSNLDKYKYYNRYPEKTQLEYRRGCEVFLLKLEALLSDNIFLTGDNIKFADVALLPFVRQFAFVDIKWFESSEYVLIRRWLQVFLESPLFEKSMTHYNQWHVGDRQVLFPVS